MRLFCILVRGSTKKVNRVKGVRVAREEGVAMEGEEESLILGKLV